MRAVGEVFAGRYELVDLLGEGGMGSVWRAWDHRRQVYCAAKVLKQSDAASLQRFVREQSLRIDHPRVLAPHGWVAEDDRVLFTMDIVGGGSVATLLGDYGPLPPPYAIALLEQLLDGLAAVHAAGVVHRDVKPANLLLEPTGAGRPRLRLSDFGVAVQLGEPRLTNTGLIIGTPGYVAPELRSGAGPDPRQDLYAVGVVGRLLLTGETDAVPARPGDGALWDLLDAMTADDPDDRPPSAAVARDRLGAVGRDLRWQAGGEPVEVLGQLPALPPGWTSAGPVAPPAAAASKPTEPVGPPTKIDRRPVALRSGRPRMLAAAAAVLVVVAIGVVIGRPLLFDRDPSTTPGRTTSPSSTPSTPPSTAPSTPPATPPTPGVVMPTYDIS